MASAQRTIDHDTIQKWVESHGGHPAHVKRTAQDSDPGILRIDFPGFSGEKSLEPLDWDTWFDAFEANQLAFLYQDKRGSDGGQSNFNKLVRRSAEDEEPQSKPHQRGQRRKGRTTGIDLNTASEEELQALYGIGPSNARKIAEYRRSKGRITPEDLANIEGIDDHMVQIIRRELAEA